MSWKSGKAQCAELRQAGEYDLRACLRAMGSGRQPGDDMLELRAHAPGMVANALERCEKALPSLIAAHLQAGDRDVEKITARLTAFAEEGLATLPGAGAYVSGRGAGLDAQGEQFREEMTARFVAGKAAVIASIRDHVVVGLAARTYLTRSARLRRAFEDNPIGLSLLIGVSGLSLFDATLWDLLRWLASLFHAR